jgi:hypothetical protein
MSVVVEMHQVKSGREYRGLRYFEHDESWEERKGWYRHVSTVKITGLPTQHGREKSLIANTVYRISQGDHRMVEGVPEEIGEVEVEVHSEEVRSSSVGDVLVIKYPSEEKEKLPIQVNRVGFRRIRKRRLGQS